MQHLTRAIYYVLNGKTPVEETDIMVWAKQIESSNRIVKQTELPNDVKVSTVFLGIDHAFLCGTPILFETMIFGGEQDGFQERSSTWEEAEKGHQKAVELVFS